MSIIKNRTLSLTHDVVPSVQAAPVPVAQYLRMSQENQAYSLENQAAANEEWAALHGFVIVKTYADPGKSGLVLKNRIGLQTLLRDVTSGCAPFKAVLVYDVSRWGRFQDMDEAAHHEFVCKRAGIPVYYCAEAFCLESTMPNLILKALKRTMAAEYSRDLGERTYIRQKRAAANGFWMSSTPGYGLRRMLLDVNGKPKHKMKRGERKALQSDRVKIVLGPRKEVECVREIFQMVIRGRGKVGPKHIADELNNRGIRHFGKRWSAQRVDAILSNPKYCGNYVWGKLSRKLHNSARKTNPSEWVVCENAIAPIVDKQTFDQAQMVRPRKRDKTTCEALLRRCKALLKRKGHLSEMLLRDTKGFPSISTIYRYFGDLWSLYRQLNYQPESARFQRETERHCAKKLREQVLNQIAASCPKHIDLIELAPNHRLMVMVDRVVPVSVLICRSFANTHRKGWIALPHLRERNCVTLLCLMDEQNTSIARYYVSTSFPTPGRCIKFDTSEEWFKAFKPVGSLPLLYWDIWEVQGEQILSRPGRLANRYSSFMIPQFVKAQ
jgi:DNA invertase Pin-like site-specific DNA recombinase